MRNFYLKFNSHTRGIVILFLCMTGMLCGAGAFAQQKTTGKVFDNAGQPIIGATVMLKGTSVGTTTGVDGSYSINVAGPTSVLSFSFIGYESKEVTVGAQKNIDVVLPESAIAIESVVSIGYGVKKKTDLTGSIGSVDAESIAAKGSVNAIEALQGSIPGVNITTNSSKAGGGFSIQIRGQNSIEGGEPIYVVDGIIVDDINFLNPSDIERIDVLKDASSNAIYGSRGSNGVVMIVTKQASSATKDKFTISYDGYYGIKNVTRMPDFMDGDEYQSWRLAAHITPMSTNSDNETTYQITEANFLKLLTSKMVWQRYADKDYFDWNNAAYQKAKMQNHFVNITGNVGKTSYVVSLGYQNEHGLFKGDNFNRGNIRAGFNTKLNKYATIGVQANASMVDNDTGSSSYVSKALSFDPLLHAYNPDGSLVIQPGSATTLGNASNGYSFGNGANPLLDLENSEANTRSYHVLTNIFAEVEPIKGLKFKSQFSPMIRTARIGKYDGALTTTRFNKAIDASELTNRNYLEYTWENSLTYSGSKGDHAYDGTLVYSIYQTRAESSYMSVENQSVPGIYGITTAKTRLVNETSFSAAQMLSFVARVNYSYKGKYLLTVTDRWDGSSKLAQKWASFPTVGAAWRIIEEPFAKDIDWLTNLKARISWGYTGNYDNIRPYSQLTKPVIKNWYAFGMSNILANGMSPDGIANSSLTWEKTRELNFGIDFAVFNGRISGTVDLYDKLSDGLLMNRQLPYEAGVYGSSMIANVGSVNNRGFEVGLSTINIKSKNVIWSTSFTFSKNKNAIRSLYGEKKDDLANRWFIGQPIDVAYTYVSDGIVSAQDAKTDWAKAWNLKEGMSKVKDIAGGPNGGPDGSITSLDRMITGSGFSDWTGSFNTSLKVYNFDLSLNAFADQGRYVRSPFMSNVTDVSGNRAAIKLNVDYYVPENVAIPNLPSDYAQVPVPLYANTSGKYPLPYNAGPYFGVNKDDYQDAFVDASFIKVKNITLGYTFPQKIAKKMMMSNLRIYANVINPFVITDYLGYDPEWATASISNSSGGPASIIWQFGVNVKF